jgi:hypothetical protein
VESEEGMTMETREAEGIVKKACNARRAVRESLAERDAASGPLLFRCEEWGSCGLEPGAATETQWLFHITRREAGETVEYVVRYDGDGDVWEAAPEHCCTRAHCGTCYEFAKGSSIRLTPVYEVTP